MKMKMFPHVRAITHRHPIQVDLAHELAPDERVQAIVDRSHGDFRHVPLGTEKDLLGRGMVSLTEQHIVDVLALARLTKPAGSQAFLESQVDLGPLTFHYL